MFCMHRCLFSIIFLNGKSIILRLYRLEVNYIQEVLLLSTGTANHILYFNVKLHWTKAAWQERRASCSVLNSRTRFECQWNCGVSRWQWESEDYLRTLSLKVTKQTIISLPIYYVPHINRCLTNVGVKENRKQKMWAASHPPSCLFICTGSIRCQPVFHFLMIDNGVSWELSSAQEMLKGY